MPSSAISPPPARGSPAFQPVPGLLRSLTDIGVVGVVEQQLVFRQLDGNRRPGTAFRFASPALIASSVRPRTWRAQRLPAHSQYCDARKRQQNIHATGWGLQGKFRTCEVTWMLVAVKSLLAAFGENATLCVSQLRSASSASRCCRLHNGDTIFRQAAKDFAFRFRTPASEPKPSRCAAARLLTSALPGESDSQSRLFRPDGSRQVNDCVIIFRR